MPRIIRTVPTVVKEDTKETKKNGSRSLPWTGIWISPRVQCELSEASQTVLGASASFNDGHYLKPSFTSDTALPIRAFLISFNTVTPLCAHALHSILTVLSNLLQQLNIKMTTKFAVNWALQHLLWKQCICV